MIHIKNLCLSFNDQIIFKDVSYTFQPDDRIGIVGLNGTGKSTLLRIISGLQQADTGIIQIPSSFKIGYMPQELTLTSNKSILEETIETHNDIDETEKPLLEIEATKILCGLGFKEEQLSQPVAQLSTGWKMRVFLAQLLMQKADFYLFDEPTNHLDIIAKEWFFNFLKYSSFGFALVSHDRYYLDNICTKILELEQGNGTRYNGNYSTYIKQKKERDTIVRATYENQQKEIAHKERTINRFRAKASKSCMAKKMEKDLNRIERITIQKKPPTIHFTFPEIRQSGKDVLDINHVSFSFPQKPIVDNVDFLLQKDERVAIIAPNGMGKTTLLNLIVGKYQPDNGTIKIGYHVKSAYFEQDQLETFHPEKTIFETLQERTQANEQAIRTILGSFLFTQDLIKKKIKVLSGGEKNRVNMACTLLQQANVLFLDEPTNHLDIYSKEILLKALKTYKGTILFVSHDHNFVNDLATSILELDNRQLAHYHGNYESYLEQKRNLGASPEQTPKTVAIQKESCGKNDFEKRKAIRSLEAKIHNREKEIATLSSALNNYEYGSIKYQKAFNDIEKKQKELEAFLQEWEALIA